MLLINAKSFQKNYLLISDSINSLNLILFTLQKID